MDERWRIAVLAGGPSAERDVSLRSGAAVSAALHALGHEIEPIDIPRARVADWRQDPGYVDRVRRRLRRLDVEAVFVALHGPFGEDGEVQRLLESIGLSYTGAGPEACALAMHKGLAQRAMASADVAVPASRTVVAGYLPPGQLMAWARQAAGTLGYPLVVKPSTQGSSLGVSLIHDEAQLPQALAGARLFDRDIILQTYIPGREVTVSILEDEPLPVVEICPQEGWFDFAAKYTAGHTTFRVPADLPRELTRLVQQVALAAYQAIGARDLARVDLILDRRSEQPVVLEVNAVPGLTAGSLAPKAAQAAGVTFGELCTRLVRRAVSRRAAQPVADLAGVA